MRFSVACALVLVVVMMGTHASSDTCCNLVAEQYLPMGANEDPCEDCPDEAVVIDSHFKCNGGLGITEYICTDEGTVTAGITYFDNICQWFPPDNYQCLHIPYDTGLAEADECESSHCQID